MNKFFYLLSFVAALSMTACEKNDSNEIATSHVAEINAVVTDGSEYNDMVSVVKLLVNGVEIARSDYRNGSFSIKLPESIDSDLKPFAADIPPQYKVSNRNTLFANATLAAYNENDERVGRFNYLCYELVIDNGEPYYVIAYESGLNYLDSDVTVTGTHTEVGEYTTTTSSLSLNLKKGWNFIYSSGFRPSSKGYYTNTMTTAEPKGMQWFFSSGNNEW